MKGSQMHSSQDCECCQASRLNAEGRPNWKRCGAGGKENQHIRHDRDGTLIKLEVNHGVYHNGGVGLSR